MEKIEAAYGGDVDKYTLVHKGGVLVEVFNDGEYLGTVGLSQIGRLAQTKGL